MLQFFSAKRVEAVVLWSTRIFIGLFVLAAALVSVNRYWQFEVFYYDFGIFDQAIWKVAHFQAPIIEHLVIGGKWIFADHFSPGMFLLSPLYWITDRSEIMLVAQAVAAGVSAWILHRVSRKVLQNEFLAAAVVVSFCLFVGLQNALITDMHEVVFMLVPLMLTIQAIVTGQKKSVWVWFGLTLLFKESAFLLGVGLGIFSWWIRRDWLKPAITMVVVALLWGALVTQMIIPAFSGTQYAYQPDFYKEPWKNVWSLVDQPMKRQTQLLSFWSFGFLPLLAPASWPLIGQDFVVRFVPQNTQGRWGLGMHYSAQLAPLLAVGMIYGLSAVQKLVERQKWANKKFFKKYWLTYGQCVFMVLAGGLILNAGYLHRFKLRGPLGLAYNKAFYAHSRDFGFLEDLIAKVPPGSSVMTQNNLAARFTHQQVWLSRDNYMEFQPEYVVFDLRADQNPNNLYAMSGSLQKIVTELQKDPHYIVLFHTADQWVFQRQK